MRKIFMVRIICLILVSSMSLTGISAAPMIDPIRFTVTTSATNLKLDEEFEITITAEYLNVSPGAVYVLKDANSFKLKLTLPEGFVKTGGDYHDFIGTELSPSRPKVSYKIKGKFVSSGSGIFELLRSHKNADSQSTFAAVGKLSFSPIASVAGQSGHEALRILSGTPGFVPYMTIDQLRSGFADTAKVVEVADAGRSGKFIYDPADLTSADDSAMIIRNGSKRFRREPGPARPEMFGAIAGDATDDYLAIQKALNIPGRVLEFTANGTYVVSASLQVPSNKIINGQGAKLTTTANNFITGLLVSGKDNVTIRNLIIDGGDSQDSFSDGILILDSRVVKVENCTIKNIGKESSSGECGFGIRVSTGTTVAPPTSTTGCKNIRISNVTIQNIKGYGQYAGDCIYIRTSDGVIVENSTLDICRRQGIAITDYATNIDVISTRITNTYLAGVDIEPDPNTTPGTTGYINLTNLFIKGFGSKPGSTIGNQYYGIDIHSQFSHDITIIGGHIIGTTSQAIAGINAQNSVHDIKIDDIEIDCNSLVGNGINLYAGNGAYNVSINNVTIKNFTTYGINSYKNPNLSIKNCYVHSTVGIVGIYSNESERDIQDNYVVMNSPNCTEGIWVQNAGLTNISNNIVKVNLGTALKVRTPSPSVISGMMFQSNKAINTGTAATAFYFDESSGAIIAPRVKNNYASGGFTNIFGGRDYTNQVNTSSTAAPSKATLNTTYGEYPAETIVRFTAITGGVREYRKLSDLTTSDWVETIWSSGAMSLAL